MIDAVTTPPKQKSPEPTPIGPVSSAFAGNVIYRRGSLGR